MDDRSKRLQAAAEQAKEADERGDTWEANEWWTRHRIIQDAGCSPFELFEKGAALNRAAESFRSAVQAGR